MKKIIILFMSLISVSCLSATAIENSTQYIDDDFTDIYRTNRRLNQRIIDVGFKILADNNIPYRMNFGLWGLNTGDNGSLNLVNFLRLPDSHEKRVYKNREIVVQYKYLYYIKTEDELAAMISREIAAGEQSYHGMFRGSFAYSVNNFFPTIAKQNDKTLTRRSVDLMVKAGYDPIAIIVYLNKTNGENRYEWLRPKERVRKRMLDVYKYIYVHYPDVIANTKFKEDAVYNNFLDISEKDRLKFQKDIEQTNTPKDSIRIF